MAEGVKIDFTTLQQVVSLVGKRGTRALHEMAPAIAESLVSEVLEVFETEGRGTWQRYWWEVQGLPKPKGRRWRGNPRLLQDTGNLVGSITPASDDLVAEAFTNVPYAKYHASKAPRAVIPLRDFFDIDMASFEADVVDMLLYRLDRDVAAE